MDFNPGDIVKIIKPENFKEIYNDIGLSYISDREEYTNKIFEIEGISATREKSYRLKDCVFSWPEKCLQLIRNKGVFKVGDKIKYTSKITKYTSKITNFTGIIVYLDGLIHIRRDDRISGSSNKVEGAFTCSSSRNLRILEYVEERAKDNIWNTVFKPGDRVRLIRTDKRSKNVLSVGDEGIVITEEAFKKCWPKEDTSTDHIFVAWNINNSTKVYKRLPEELLLIESINNPESCKPKQSSESKCVAEYADKKGRECNIKLRPLTREEKYRMAIEVLCNPKSEPKKDKPSIQHQYDPGYKQKIS